MRLQSVLAPSVAAAMAFAASTARTDGVYLTLKDSTGTALGVRVPLATFTAGTQQAAIAGGKPTFSPTTFDVLDIALDTATITGDQVSTAGGVSTESTSVSYLRAKVTDDVAQTTLTVK